MLFSSLSKFADVGLLIVRIILGVMFIFYGAPKLFGGPQVWAQVGQAVSSVGINFAFTFWGFMAAFSMFFGGICVILGLFFRLMCMFLFITMFVAVSMHLRKGDGLMVAAHALEDGAVFLGLIFLGPGRYSLDVWLKSILNLR